MAYPIEKKFVIAVTTSALLDMEESDIVYREAGITEYRKYQETHVDDLLDTGVAFPFIRRFLTLNDAFPNEQPVEVVVFSRNSPDTGIRALRSIKKHGLDITRSVFTSGNPNFRFLPAYNSTLFLSSNPEDTRAAIVAGYAAGTVLSKNVEDNLDDKELRIGFDFDSVLVDDSSEQYYQLHDSLGEYMSHEARLASTPMPEGPLRNLLSKLSNLQKMEREKAEQDNTYHPIIQTSIITARNAPAHERVVTTLKAWQIDVDQVFFMGGIEKSRVLNILQPHIFFDDQKVHFKNLVNVPAVHIPFGVTNDE